MIYLSLVGKMLYAGGRISSAFAQLFVTVLAARYLSVQELAAFAIALTFAMLAGTVGNPNLRRLILDHWPGEDLSGFKIAVIVLNAAVLVPFCGVAYVVFGADTAFATLSVVLWRVADNFAEVGLGARLHRREYSVAGAAMLGRAVVGMVPCVYFFMEGRFIAGLAGSAVVRLVWCWMECETATKWGWSKTGIQHIGRSLQLGCKYAGPNIACMAFDAVPTLVVGKILTSEFTAALAPLGRIRLGLVMIGTIAVDLCYSRFIARRRARAPLGAELFRVNGGMFIVTAALLLLLVTGGFRIAFGSSVPVSYLEIIAVCGAGYATVITTSISSALTVSGLLHIQTLVFGGGALLLSIGVMVWPVSLVSFYLAQAAVMLLIGAIFYRQLSLKGERAS